LCPQRSQRKPGRRPTGGFPKWPRSSRASRRRRRSPRPDNESFRRGPRRTVDPDHFARTPVHCDQTWGVRRWDPRVAFILSVGGRDRQQITHGRHLANWRLLTSKGMYGNVCFA
jgi:hypothetical protein